MKKYLSNLMIVLTLILFFTACSKDASAHYSGQVPDHPRILLLKGEENQVKANINTDYYWKIVHDMIIAECNVIISNPPVERILIGRRLLDKSREALKRIFYLSYAYRITGNRAFLDRAEKEMLAVSAFTDWNPSHFLDVAEMTMAVAIGYDWLYESLSENTRQVVRDAIINKGLKPSLDSKYNSWLRATHNWNQVCNAGMTYGALAIWEYDSTLASDIINRACESILLPMEDYKPDGAYPEGYGYWGYGTSFNVMFISAYEKAFGKKFESPATESFLKTAYYMVNMSGPTGQCFNYSDNGSGTGLHPAMFWLASRLGDYSVLYEEMKFLGQMKRASDRLLPAMMIWNAGITKTLVKEPARLMWTGGGKNPVALMRTSWSNPDAIFVGLKGGSPRVNHGHMDVGSFVMESEGVRWAMDFGAQDYNSLEQKGVDLWNMSQNSQRWKVFRYNNFVHNTLTVNGQLQRVDGKAEMISSSSTPLFMNAVMDLAPVYSGQLTEAKRGVAIADNKYVIVRDEIQPASDNTTVRWTMLTSASVNITGPGMAELTKNNRKLIIKVNQPASVTMKTWSTDPPHDYDAPNPGTILVGFEIVVPAGKTTSVEVLLIPGNTDPSSVTGKGELKNWPAVK
ncbi:MAG TPA: heparinase II/III family protein [Bacteroidales bacterium]|nr:heparinase II/III family protein [Bacteroidales bacterium]HOK74904.1 heparinase II/III family protein [Bacteroidales bacterium]HOM41236.1 heparinase II/III family protein [Bacteroidales bacterium]HPP93273.1 heparinase II/III family protein [Bacteroidales bacterium]